nr:unnamed protein product [Ipomoea batatas]
MKMSICCQILITCLEFFHPRCSRSLLEIKFGKGNTHQFMKWKNIVTLKLQHKSPESHPPKMMEIMIDII